jgi:hypothetical protein
MGGWISGGKASPELPAVAEAGVEFSLDGVLSMDGWSMPSGVYTAKPKKRVFFLQDGPIFTVWVIAGRDPI